MLRPVSLARGVALALCALRAASPAAAQAVPPRAMPRQTVEVQAPPVPAIAPAASDTLAAWLRASHPHGPTVSAHRGGVAPGFPENALETFARTAARVPRVLLETDVRLTRDSVLVLLHDDGLDRTTTGAGAMADASLDALRRLALRDPDGQPTAFRVPTLAEALAWGRGRAVFTLDPKLDVPPRLLVRALREARAEGYAVVITYTPEQYAEYVALAPDLVYSVTVDGAATLDRLLAVPGANPCRWIAFVGTDAPNRALNERLRRLDVRTMQGVFGEAEADARAQGPSRLAPLRNAAVDVVATGAVDAAALLPPLPPPKDASCARPDAPDVLRPAPTHNVADPPRRRSARPPGT